MEEYIILLKHSEGSLFIFDDIIKAGYKIIYVDKVNHRPEITDIFLDFNPLLEMDLLIESSIEMLQDLNIIGVITFAEHLKLSEMRLAKRLGILQSSAETYHRGRDKYLMKSDFEKSDIPVIEYKFYTDGEEIPEEPIDFPFIIKPNTGYASGGVQLIKNKKDLKSAISAIKRLNFFVLKNEVTSNIGIICEKFIKGFEFSVDSIHAEGKVRSICICQRGFLAEENFSDYIYTSPPKDCPVNIKEFEEIISKVTTQIGFDNGATHAEFRIDENNGKIYLLEIALRVGFGGNIGRLCELTTGLNYNSFAVKASVGKLPFSELEKVNITANKVAVCLVPDPMEGGIINKIEGLDFLRSDNRIIHFHFYKVLGEKIIPWPRTLEYIGEILAVANNYQEMNILQKEIIDKVKIKYK